MTKELEHINEVVRSSLIKFDEVKETIEEIETKNLIDLKVKEKLKAFTNTILADLLIYNNFLFELSEALNSDELEMLIDELTRGEDEDI